MFSQTVNGKYLSELDTHYLQITVISELFNSKLYLNIDYGQDFKFEKNSYLLDANGTKMRFNSFVAICNYLLNNGFEYYDTKTIRHDNVNNDTYVYTFKKRSSK